MRTYATLAAALLFAAAAGDSRRLPTSLPAEPIPPGFDPPHTGCDLRRAVDRGDEAKLREHSWNVFAGMTQPAARGWIRPTVGPKKPIWLTWHGVDETFPSSSGGGGTRRLDSDEFQLEQSVQLESASSQKILKDAGCGTPIVSVFFNEAAYQHITTKQSWNGKEPLSDCEVSTPATSIKPHDVVMNSRPSKNAYVKGLAGMFDQSLARASVRAFPSDSVAVKAVWWAIPSANHSKYTALPVWDGVPDDPKARVPAYPFCEWPRAVIVDADISHADPVAPAATVSFAGKELKSARTVSIRDFFYYTMTQREADAWNAARSGIMPTAQAGDYSVLVAMHFTTKEIVNWTWATFWWHDKPEQGRFARNRPSTVKGEWAHYLMDVSYDMDLPREKDGTPHVCFNPWLEASMPGGTESNCVTCHRLSVWPRGHADPVLRGNIPADHPLFDLKAKLDYLWSIARR
jgi:hypothetical protein